MIISGEGVVKMADGGDVPYVAGQGTCQEDAGVIKEVGEDDVHEFLRKPGNW